MDFPLFCSNPYYKYQVLQIYSMCLLVYIYRNIKAIKTPAFGGGYIYGYSLKYGFYEYTHFVIIVVKGFSIGAISIGIAGAELIPYAGRQPVFKLIV